MSMDQESYEIYAAAKKNWRLLNRVTTSGQAIEEATKLQHSEKYSAIQVIVRSTTNGEAADSSRLLYQFSRPGAPALDRDPLLPSIETTIPAHHAIDDQAQTSERSRWMLYIASGAVVTLALLTFILAG
jgi:hypothetical protein